MSAEIEVTRFTLSRLGFPMLRELVSRGVDRPMPVEEAAKYDQRPFGSMLHRQWIKYTPRKGFVVTKLGIAAWNDFNSGSIFRHDATRPLSHYFDPTLYGLNSPKKTRPVKKPEERAATK